MSCYRLPDQLCIRLNSLTDNFWWGQVGTTKQQHWISWSRLSLPKHIGGWISKILSSLIKPYWLSNVGESFRIRSYYFLGYYGQNILMAK
ncbi:hypothetical protein LINPERHAP1_LOCUS12637 [Linum perenne]